MGENRAHSPPASGETVRTELATPQSRDVSQGPQTIDLRDPVEPVQGPRPEAEEASLTGLPARLWLRASATAIDGLTVMVVLFFLPQPVNYAIPLVMFIAYETIFVWLTGQSPGKAICGLEVRRIGGPRRLVWALGRSSIGFFVINLGGVGSLWGLRDPHGRTLHDLVFGSDAVIKERLISVPSAARALKEWAERQLKAVDEKKGQLAIMTGLWLFLMKVATGAQRVVGPAKGKSRHAPSAAHALGTRAIATLATATTAAAGVTILAVPGARSATHWLTAPRYVFAPAPPPANASFALSPRSVDFGPSLVGSRGGPATVTVKNTGGLSGSIAGLKIAGDDARDFSIQIDRCGAAKLGPGDSCTLGLVFSTATTGHKRASLWVEPGAREQAGTILLMGIGTDTPTTSTPGAGSSPSGSATPGPHPSPNGAVTPGSPSPSGSRGAGTPTPHPSGTPQIPVSSPLEFTPRAPDFGAQDVLAPGPPLSIRVMNTTKASLMLAGLSLGGDHPEDFAVQSGGCGAGVVLAPGGSCGASVTFSPHGAGLRSAQFIVIYQGHDTASVPLIGTGTEARLTATPASIDFGSQAVGTNTTVQLTVANSGSEPLIVTKVSVGGTAWADFFPSLDSCSGASIKPQTACTVEVIFRPTTRGLRTATLSVQQQGTGGTLVVRLSGVGRAPSVAVVATPSGNGYWTIDSDGGVANFGDAVALSLSQAVTEPILGAVRTASGGGLWLFSATGSIYTIGDAKYLGSTGSIKLNKPIVAMAGTPSGNGYMLVATDGGIFSFGDAQFFGSTGSIHLNQPIVSLAPTPSGQGYWEVGADGALFAYGDATVFGSAGATTPKPVVAGAATRGKGIWLVAGDGTVYPFGDAQQYGSPAPGALKGSVVAIAALPRGNAYLLLSSSGQVFQL